MQIVATLLVLAASVFAAAEALEFRAAARSFPLGAALAGILFAGSSMVFDILNWRSRNEGGETEPPRILRAAIHFAHVAVYLALFVTLGFTLGTALYTVVFLASMTTGEPWRVRLASIVGLSSLAVALTIALKLIAGRSI